MKNNGSECLMTVDGTDFRIQEPQPFDAKWYSHKFNAAALRYEIGICIQTGWIVWTAGPFPAGDFNDLEIYRSYLKDMLGDGERVEVDEGYAGDLTVRTPSDYEGKHRWKVMKGKARARHEGINGRLKDFGMLRIPFRGNRNHHCLAFKAITLAVQSEIMSGRATFDVSYYIVRENQW